MSKVYKEITKNNNEHGENLFLYVLFYEYGNSERLLTHMRTMYVVSFNYQNEKQSLEQFGCFCPFLQLFITY